MDVCPRLCVLCCPVQRQELRRDRPPVEGVLPNVEKEVRKSARKVLQEGQNSDWALTPIHPSCCPAINLKQVPPPSSSYLW
jgi:hypothetical protein